jgi:hypothetical protein
VVCTQQRLPRIVPMSVDDLGDVWQHYLLLSIAVLQGRRLSLCLSVSLSLSPPLWLSPPPKRLKTDFPPLKLDQVLLECYMGPKRPISLAVRAIEQIRLRVDLGNAAHVCAQIQNLVKGFSIEATPATAAKVVPSTAETPLDRVGRPVFPHGERRFGRAVGYSGNFLRQAQRQVL